MQYAIGAPGQIVRVYIDVADPEIVDQQLQEGEVSGAVLAPVMNATINADGSITPPKVANDGE